MVGIAGLYGIVDLDSADEARADRLARALLDGGARIVQLRMKHASAAQQLACGRIVAAACREREARFIVNDRLDVALVLGADGVHLGQDDLPIAAARPLCPTGFLIGVSTHNRAQAADAVAAGADYLGFGPCFPTASKQNPDPVVGLAQLAAVCAATPRPVVAIGGITRATIGDVARAGAHAAAVIGAVTQAPDPVAASIDLSARFWAATAEAASHRAAIRSIR